ncbi:flagellar hook-length control protein FliK [Dethiothermospora halolimnae]|uniref:flagellar hook-length control protein FliK n=1 Tax=Dethiothermospora halolimnae TaxID=3114390 RepID=UPI003CCBC7ED
MKTDAILKMVGQRGSQKNTNAIGKRQNNKKDFNKILNNKKNNNIEGKNNYDDNTKSSGTKNKSDSYTNKVKQDKVKQNSESSNKEKDNKIDNIKREDKIKPQEKVKDNKKADESLVEPELIGNMEEILKQIKETSESIDKTDSSESKGKLMIKLQSISKELQNILSRLKDNNKDFDMSKVTDLFEKIKDSLNNSKALVLNSSIKSSDVEKLIKAVDDIQKKMATTHVKFVDIKPKEEITNVSKNVVYNAQAEKLQDKKDKVANETNDKKINEQISKDGTKVIEKGQDGLLENSKNFDNNNLNSETITRGYDNLKTIEKSGQFEKVIEESNIKNNLEKYEVIKQISDKIKVDFNKDNPEIKIRLKPNFLGEVSLKMELDKGNIIAKAFVEDGNIKQLIESNLDQLKTTLKEQGIEISEFDVSVGKDDTSDHRGQQFWFQNKNNKRKKKVKLDSEEILEKVMYNSQYAENDQYIHGVSVGSVDYMA